MRTTFLVSLFVSPMIRLCFKQTLWGRRPFSVSFSRLKDDYKKQLKNLGSILLQGKVGDAQDRKLTDLDLESQLPKQPSQLALDITVKENIDELEDCFEKVAFMTKDDIAIQENFDQGGQFGSFPSEHFFDRRELIRSLPDEVDLLETPWEEIERVYKLLEKLDVDRSVHAKYLKKFGIDDNDLITRLRMGNNLRDMCSSGRRGEKYEISKGLERVFKKLYQYNVVGFDRSLVGVPLRGGKNNLKKNASEESPADAFPTELIRDMRPFDTKVPVHKVDVNFLDDDLLKESISPFDAKPLPPEDLLRDVGKPIFLDTIDNYRKVEHPSMEFLTRIEKETILLKDALYLEITRKMIPTGTDVITFNSQKLKTNEYVIASKDHDATTISGPTTSYRFKQFDLVPIYGMLLSTVKHYNNLYKHLFRVILINLDEHVDVLTRIKYTLARESNSFMRKLYARIHKAVSDKLMPLALKSRIQVPKQYNAVLHKHILCGNFLRIYWVRKPGVGLRTERRDFSRNVRRKAQSLNILILNPANLLK